MEISIEAIEDHVAKGHRINVHETLFRAAQVGNLEVCQYMIQIGASTNKAIRSGVSPLAAAITSRHYSVARFLLQHGADTNLEQSDLGTALHAAVAMGDLEACRLLLKFDADMNHVATDGISPLLLAVHMGRFDLCRLMVAADDHCGAVALEAAIARNRPDIVSFLLQAFAVPTRNTLSLAAEQWPNDAELMLRLQARFDEAQELPPPPPLSPAMSYTVSPPRSPVSSYHSAPLSVEHSSGLETSADAISTISPIAAFPAAATAAPQADSAERSPTKPLFRTPQLDRSLFTQFWSSPIQQVTDPLSPVSLFVPRKVSLSPQPTVTYPQQPVQVVPQSPTYLTERWQLQTQTFSDVIVVDVDGVQHSPASMLHPSPATALQRRTYDTAYPSAATDASPLVEAERAAAVRCLTEDDSSVTDTWTSMTSEMSTTAANLSFVSTATITGAAPAVGGTGSAVLPTSPMTPTRVRRPLSGHFPSPSPQPDSAHALTAAGDLDKLSQYLTSGGAIDVRNEEGDTLLLHAALFGHVAVCEFLLSHGADVNAVDNAGLSALFCAAQHGFVEICQTLLRHGCDVNLRAYDGTTALFMSCQTGNLDLCRLLLDRQGDCNVIAVDGVTPLFLTAQCGHYNICALLLERGANVYQRDITGASPLYAAAQYGHTAVCELLLRHHASADECTHAGSTPLHAAASFGHVDTVNKLLLFGANPTLADHQGRTASDYAALAQRADIANEIELYQQLQHTRLRPLSKEHPQTFTYEALENATEQFKEGNLRGRSDDGVVYEGRLEGVAVAVKSYNLEQQTDAEFALQLKQLHSYRHRNIVAIYGFCQDSQHHCVIYELMQCCLLDRLHSTSDPPLTWSERIVIAVDVASGLQHMHDTDGDRCLLHELNSRNVLLDESGVAKLSDDGSLRPVHVWRKRMHGYLPPEAQAVPAAQYQHTRASDVFAFGVLLLEIITNRAVVAEHRQPQLLSRLITEYVSHSGSVSMLVDPSAGEWPAPILKTLTVIALTCLSTQPRERLPVPELVRQLRALHRRSIRFVRDAGFGTVRKAALSASPRDEKKLLNLSPRQHQQKQLCLECMGAPRTVQLPCAHVSVCERCVVKIRARAGGCPQCGHVI